VIEDVELVIVVARLFLWQIQDLHDLRIGFVSFFWEQWNLIGSWWFGFQILKD
jgi:hypothetical protein